MDSFSWTDSFRAAVGTCLPCFSCSQGSSSDTENESSNGRMGALGRQTRFEELEGLLGDADDADTMSLHSNIGLGQQRRRKKKRTRKNIQLFGFNLFGRQPIELSESDDEDELGSARRRRLALGQNPSAHSSSSGSAFDPDAAPLDPADISRLTAQDAAARAADLERLRQAEEQRKKEEREDREERRRRRKERKELKRVAEAIASGTVMSMDGHEFEGFQGSGGLSAPSHLPGGQAPVQTLSGPAEEFGPYVGAQSSNDDQADVDADFGGEVYTRKPRSHGSDSSRSQTRSRTSATQSNTGSSQSYNHHYVSQGSPLPSPTAYSPSTGFPSGQASERKKRRKNLSISQGHASRASTSIVSPPTSQSASLPSLDSPVSTTPTLSEPHVVDAMDQNSPNSSHSFAAMQSDNKFPMVGFGGMKRMDSARDGAFLANSGRV